MSGPTQPETPGRLRDGEVVGGRYVIDGFLARGGFATVYRAHHEQIGRKLAIKVLEPPHRADAADSFRQRFLQEAKLAARIDHPGVVDVFDFGLLDDGRTYLAMDLLEGRDLEQELKIGPMPALRVVPLFIECLAALHEGHRQGIVHKDLKPSNLFLVRAGEPGERLVILDFGIARVFQDPGTRVTQDGGFSGTPAYLAPEYIRHQTVAPAIDVYQMGLILIEALTGAPAVVSDNSMGYLLAHCLHPIVLPKALADTELGAVCLRAVEKEPGLRYADAGEFREALAAIERDALADTAEMTTHELPTMHPDGSAKTLQFINLTRDDLDLLLDEPVPPPATTVSADSSGNLGMLAVAVTALTIVAGALLIWLVHEPQAERSGPAAEPPPVLTAHIEAPPAAVPEPPEPSVAPDLGSSDVADAGSPDVAGTPLVEPAAARDPEPAPKPHRRRIDRLRRIKKRDARRVKHADPLLLSP